MAASNISVIVKAKRKRNGERKSERKNESCHVARRVNLPRRLLSLGHRPNTRSQAATSCDDGGVRGGQEEARSVPFQHRQGDRCE